MAGSADALKGPTRRVRKNLRKGLSIGWRVRRYAELFELQAAGYR